MSDLKQMGVKEIGKKLPSRIMQKLFEFLGWKGIILSLTIRMSYDKIFADNTAWVWIIVILLLLFDKKAFDIIKEIKK
jgi:hypothetical protein